MLPPDRFTPLFLDMRVAFDATTTSAASTTAKTCIRVLCKLPYAATLTPGSPNAAPFANKVKCSGKTKRSILTSCAQTFARETNAQSARAVDPASHHDFGSCRRCLRHPSRSTTPHLFVSADGWMASPSSANSLEPESFNRPFFESIGPLAPLLARCGLGKRGD